METIIWDYDGVLSDTNRLKEDVFVSFYEYEDVDFVKRIRNYHKNNGGVGRFEKFKLWNTWLGIDNSKKHIDSMCVEFSKRSIIKMVETPFNELALDIIQRKSFTHSIASAGDEKDLIEILRMKNLLQYFHTVCGGPGSKVQILKKCIENSPKPIKIFIGDSMADYTAALETQIPFNLYLNKENKKIKHQIPENLWITNFQY